MATSLCDTASAVFKEIYTFKVPDEDGMEVYSLKGDKDLGAIIDAVHTDNPELNQVNNRIKQGKKLHVDTGIRLYDDTCDIEMRSYKALDDIINRELNYYQKVYNEKGLKGLLEELFNS